MMSQEQVGSEPWSLGRLPLLVGSPIGTAFSANCEMPNVPAGRWKLCIR